MFSLSIMTFVIAVGEHPFLTDGKLDLEKQKDANWAFLENTNFSKEFQHFLIETGHRYKHQRLTSFSALQHPFIKGSKLSEEDEELLSNYYTTKREEYSDCQTGLRNILRLGW